MTIGSGDLGTGPRADGPDVIGTVITVSRALVGVAARSLAATEDDVTLAQYRVLVLLAERGDQNVGALAGLLDVHPSTATRMCDRLAAKGLVHRASSTASRRRVTVGLTPVGLDLLDSVTRRRRREIELILDRLSVDERQQLVLAFEAFGRAADEVPDSAWRLGWTA